jgi:putative chitinase
VIDLQSIRTIMPHAGARAEFFLSPINDAMLEADITTVNREAAFIAQLAHESGELRYMKELSDGKAYEGRLDLGNTEPGDGPRFKGRGPIQITGRSNYLACSLALYGDDRLLSSPEVLEQPSDGCRASAWFWKTHGLNELADAQDFRTITKRINGGYNGLDDRFMYYNRALAALA